MITLFVFLLTLFSANAPAGVPADNAELLAADKSFNKSDCTCKGIPLKGKVKVVSYGEDLTVQVVSYGANLSVQAVSYSPDNCGQWQFVDHGEDFTVKFVDYGEDFEIMFVERSPGVR
jgi:hypothetical protein